MEEFWRVAGDIIFVQSRKGRWHLSKELKEMKRKILVFDSCEGRKVFSIKQSFPKGSSDIRNTDKYGVVLNTTNIIFIFPYTISI